MRSGQFLMFFHFGERKKKGEGEGKAGLDNFIPEKEKKKERGKGRSTGRG